MKTFRCDNCDSEVFFKNDRCVKCGYSVGYLPDLREMRSFAGEPLEADLTLKGVEGKCRPCSNWIQHKVCNWFVPIADNQPFCVACRMNEVIPDLTVNGNLERWKEMELAKRRCLYTLQYLSLPFSNTSGTSLLFRFLAETPDQPVLTGHEDGLITVNIAEADEDERVRRKIKFHEPYRSIVGHFRHELGHYYWDHLIANTPNLETFRQLFGDESVDYGEALKTYYQNGPNPEKSLLTITAYASAHPWEDWAETWAHYLHIIDMMETSLAYGLVVKNQLGQIESPAQTKDFKRLLDQWVPLTCALNTINRGMGLPDLYPFVLTTSVGDKLCYIHQVVQGAQQANVAK